MKSIILYPIGDADKLLLHHALGMAARVVVRSVGNSQSLRVLHKSVARETVSHRQMVVLTLCD